MFFKFFLKVKNEGDRNTSPGKEAIPEGENHPCHLRSQLLGAKRAASPPPKVDGHCHSNGLCAACHVNDYVGWDLPPPQYFIQVNTSACHRSTPTREPLAVAPVTRPHLLIAGSESTDTQEMWLP